MLWLHFLWSFLGTADSAPQSRPFWKSGSTRDLDTGQTGQGGLPRFGARQPRSASAGSGRVPSTGLRRTEDPSPAASSSAEPSGRSGCRLFAVQGPLELTSNDACGPAGERGSLGARCRQLSWSSSGVTGYEKCLPFQARREREQLGNSRVGARSLSHFLSSKKQDAKTLTGAPAQVSSR